MECLICHQEYEEEGNICPYVLLCGHTFCYNDIRLLIERIPIRGYNQREITSGLGFQCPLCQRQINLNQYENQFPPKNFGFN